MTQATAPSWTCCGCGVEASRSDTAEVPLPPHWEDCAEGTFCLGCRRQRVSEAAVDAAPELTDRNDRVRLRRSALIEFEVTRAPERTNGSIAKACRSSVPAVAAARQRLDDPGG